MNSVIFDFFGVIHDDPLKIWLPDVAEEAHPMVAAAARDLDLGNIGYSGFLDRLAEASGQSLSQIGRYFLKATANPDVIGLLAELKGNAKLALLSNAAGEELHPILDRHGLYEFFDEVVISSEVGMAKPDACIFEHILGRLCASPEEAVFVDDNIHNVEAARRLGLNGILFKNAEDVRRQLQTTNAKEKVCAES